MKWLRTYYGHDNSPYLTRAELGQATTVNVFHRGDSDPDPHCHPWDFWTYPLVSYYEEYLEPDRAAVQYVPCVRLVQAFRWHHRAAEHQHRVLGKAVNGAPGAGRVVTLMRRGPVRREWGFWVPDTNARYGRRMVPWRQYLGLADQ
jgi:hypothetical protein